MDLIFRKRKLKLKLTPYEIISTGVNCGLVEFISDSFSIDYINKRAGVDLDMFYKKAFPGD